jgi:fructose-specific phosphotransferase system IIC component
LSLARSLFVAALMGAAAYGVERAIFGAYEDPTRTVRALSVGGAVVAGVALYALLSLLLRAPEMGQILTLRRRRAG